MQVYCTAILQVFPHLVPLLLPLTQMALTGSLYTILAVAIERYLSITRYLYSHISVSTPSVLYWQWALNTQVLK